jgi:hypothetical protein
LNCHFYDVGSSAGGKGAIYAFSDPLVMGCYFSNNSGSNTMDDAIYLRSGGWIINNIFSLNGVGDRAILVADGGGALIMNNSLFGGTGSKPTTAIRCGIQGCDIINNAIENFTIGIDSGTALDAINVLAYNCFYNNTTNISSNASTYAHLNLGNNTALSASPFAKDDADTFASRFNYFRASNTNSGDVQTGGYPTGG